MMKKILLTTILLFAAGISHAQTDTQNYVYTKSCLGADCIKKTEVIQYFDGLGRPFQTIDIKGTPLKKDMVSHIEYDQYGRPSKSYLPVPQQGTQNGLIYDNPLNNASSSYGSEKIFSEQIVENSPLERLKQSFGTGAAWSNKPISYEYNTNTIATEVVKYTVTTGWVENRTESHLNNSGFYAVNTLMKTSVTDEDGNKVTEYKNGKGQTLLVKKNDGINDLKTYYVYDKFNQLAYVIPPLASAIMNLSTTDIDNLCYQYRYDGLGRLVEKKLPGKGWEYFVYDKQDRLVASQDTELKEKGQWLYTKYDALGRVAFTGIASGGLRNAEQSLADGFGSNNVKRTDAVFFNREGMDVYYDPNGTYPGVGWLKVLSINYYDTYPLYSFNPTFPTEILGEAVLSDNPTTGKSTIGMPVMNVIKNIEDDNWTKNYIWYDTKGRGIGSHLINYMGGYTKTESELDFAGMVKRTNIYHVRKQDETGVTIKERFVYDDQNRLLQHYHKVNDRPEELLAENTYNELSQLVNKKVGNNLQSTDYAYNIRGWLTDINKNQMALADLGGKLFSYKIKYNQKDGITNPDNILFPGKNVTAKYNGNIAEIDWRAVETIGVNPSATPKRYGYAYDSLNRLTAGYYQNPNNPYSKENTESLDYDLNGNISKLYRTSVTEYGGNTATLIDNLQYAYNGNKATIINDYSYNSTGYEGGGIEIHYDLNGNMKDIADKGIDAIKYNFLNLANNLHLNKNGIEDITIDTKYSADGTKLRKENTTVATGIAGSTVTKTIVDYLDGFQYSKVDAPNTGGGSSESFSARAMEPQAFSVENMNAVTLGTKAPDLQFFPTAEGFYDYVKDQYIYQHTDQAGNVRLSFARNSAGALEITDANDYYPFGMNHLKTGNAYFGKGNYKNYKFNGVELQETGLYAMDWRNYMPDLGRFAGIDMLAESYQDLTPNHFAANNPISFSDPTGMYVREYDGSTTYTRTDEISELQNSFDGRVDDLAKYMSDRNVFKAEIPGVTINGKGNSKTWNLGSNYLSNSYAMSVAFSRAAKEWQRQVGANEMMESMVGVRSDGPIQYVGGAGDPMGIWEVGGMILSASDNKAMNLAALPLLVMTKNGDDALKLLAAEKGAIFGASTSNNYKANFFNVNPELKGTVVVHHAVEQQVLKRYPGVVTQSEMHSLENLRGIPKEVNSDVHLSQIRKIWNKFYKQNPNPTKQQLLDHATLIDQKFGQQFKPKLK